MEDKDKNDDEEEGDEMTIADKYHQGL